jgi:hypothetical protein
MNEAVHEVTVKIKRDELQRLLDTMSPPALQTITTRTPIIRSPNPARTAAALITSSPRITRPVPLLRAKTQPGAAKPSPIVVPEAPVWEAPPRIEMTEVPAADAIEIHSALSHDNEHSIAVSPHAPEIIAPRFTSLIATVLFLGICAVFFLA